MGMRRRLVLVLVGILPCLGASYRTTNFVVEAATPQIAQQVGLAAEQYRREKALEWLGREMAPWPDPCPLQVKVTMNGAGGATTFAFDRGRVLGQNMHIEGTLDRLLASVLPHEVTHTVFAYYFRTPVPRWADEGGAVLSEDDVEKKRHDSLVRQILNAGRAIPLRRLFSLREYPSDVMSLYAEGYSVANFLVESSNRPTFLAFVAHGMQYGWDSAVQTHYRYRNVEELEQAWLSHLRETRRQPPALLARNNGPARVDPARRTIVRLTAPPVQPLAETPTPIFRGQAPGPEQDEIPQGRPGVNRPGYLPDAYPPSNRRMVPPQGFQDRWQPATSAPPPAPVPGVRLGQPQQLPGTPAPVRAIPSSISPAGYPY